MEKRIPIAEIKSSKWRQVIIIGERSAPDEDRE